MHVLLFIKSKAKPSTLVYDKCFLVSACQWVDARAHTQTQAESGFGAAYYFHADVYSSRTGNKIGTTVGECVEVTDTVEDCRETIYVTGVGSIVIGGAVSEDATEVCVSVCFSTDETSTR